MKEKNKILKLNLEESKTENRKLVSEIQLLNQKLKEKDNKIVIHDNDLAKEKQKIKEILLELHPNREFNNNNKKNIESKEIEEINLLKSLKGKCDIKEHQVIDDSFDIRELTNLKDSPSLKIYSLGKEKSSINNKKSEINTGKELHIIIEKVKLHQNDIKHKNHNVKKLYTSFNGPETNNYKINLSDYIKSKIDERSVGKLHFFNLEIISLNIKKDSLNNIIQMNNLEFHYVKDK